MLFMLTRQTGAIRMGYQWGRVWEGGGGLGVGADHGLPLMNTSLLFFFSII